MTNFLKSFFLVGQFNRLCLTKRTNNVIFLPSNIGLKQGPKATLETLEIPERPKRSLTAYMQFVAERRPKLLANNPQKKLTEVVKQIAEEWREAHPEIKHKYEELARKDKENYEKRLLQYMNNLTEEQQAALKEINSKDRAASKARRIKREQRKEDKPKKPPPAYFYFVIEHAKGDNKQIRELLIKMKGEWANLTEVEKEKYNVQYAEHKKQYEKELAAWEEKMISEGKKQLVRRRTLKDNALHKKKTRKVKKSKQGRECLHFKTSIEASLGEDTVLKQLETTKQCTNSYIPNNVIGLSEETDKIKETSTQDKEKIRPVEEPLENKDVKPNNNIDKTSNIKSEDVSSKNRISEADQNVSEKSDVSDGVINKFRKLFKFQDT